MTPVTEPSTAITIPTDHSGRLLAAMIDASGRTYVFVTSAGGVRAITCATPTCRA